MPCVRSAALLLLLGALLHAAHVHAGEGEDSNANDAGSNNKTAGAGKKDKKKKFNPNDSPLGPTVTTFYKTIKVDGIPGHTTCEDRRAQPPPRALFPHARRRRRW